MGEGSAINALAQKARSHDPRAQDLQQMSRRLTCPPHKARHRARQHTLPCLLIAPAEGPDKGVPSVLDSEAAPVAAKQHALSTATNWGPKPKRYL